MQFLGCIITTFSRLQDHMIQIQWSQTADITGEFTVNVTENANRIVRKAVDLCREIPLKGVWAGGVSLPFLSIRLCILMSKCFTSFGCSRCASSIARKQAARAFFACSEFSLTSESIRDSKWSELTTPINTRISGNTVTDRIVAIVAHVALPFR